MENNYKHNHFRIYKDIYFYIQKAMLFNDTMLRLCKRGHSPGPLLPRAFSCRVPGRLPHPGPVSLHLVLGYTSSPQHPLIKYADTSKAWTSSSQVWPPWLEPEAWLGGGGGCGQTGRASGYKDGITGEQPKEAGPGPGNGSFDQFSALGDLGIHGSNLPFWVIMKIQLSR